LIKRFECERGRTKRGKVQRWNVCHSKRTGDEEKGTWRKKLVWSAASDADLSAKRRGPKTEKEMLATSFNSRRPLPKVTRKFPSRSRTKKNTRADSEVFRGGRGNDKGRYRIEQGMGCVGKSPGRWTAFKLKRPTSGEETPP